jgi:DNA-directed RNA polymerase subunit RPC12/RpoP
VSDVVYVCAKCGKEVKNLDMIRCVYCGGRIFKKTRPQLAKEKPTD